MRLAAALVATLLSLPALAECTRADPKAIAAAEQKASDAEHKAQQAESVAVRSGNPGAQARANQARAAASAAQEEVARLQCKSTAGAEGTPRPVRPPTGY